VIPAHKGIVKPAHKDIVKPAHKDIMVPLHKDIVIPVYKGCTNVSSPDDSSLYRKKWYFTVYYIRYRDTFT